MGITLAKVDSMPRAGTPHRPLIEAVIRQDWPAAEALLNQGHSWWLVVHEDDRASNDPDHVRMPDVSVFPEHDLLWMTTAFKTRGTDTWDFLTRHGAPFFPALDAVDGRRTLLGRGVDVLRLDLAEWLVARGIAPERFLAMPFVRDPSTDPQQNDLAHAGVWSWWLDHLPVLSPATDGRSAHPHDHLRACLGQAIEHASLIKTVERLLKAGADASTVCMANPGASPGVAIPGPGLLAEREGGSALHVLAIAAAQELHYASPATQTDTLARFEQLWSLLLAAGADPQAANADGQTAQERAATFPVLDQFFRSRARAQAAQAIVCPHARSLRHRA